MKLPTFEEAWAQKEAAGYKYGRDALEQVKLGWQMAFDSLAPLLAQAGHYQSLSGRLETLDDMSKQYPGLVK